jgi:PEGA domain
MSMKYMRLILVSLAMFIFVSVLGAPEAEARKPWKIKGRRGWSYRVYIESTPEGAAVYVNDKKYGIMCYTPCNRIRMPRRKKAKLIFVKAGYKELTREYYHTSSYRKKYVRVVMIREIQPGIIDIQSDATGNASGAFVYVDGANKGTVPMKVKVKPGRHQVVVRKNGFTAHTQWVTISEKQVWTIQAILKTLAKPKGTLLISADIIGAEVFVDGKSKGNAPVVVPNLQPGPHTVEVKKAGAQAWKQVVVVQSGKTKTITANVGATIVKTGLLKVVCNVPGAEVYVDGEKKGVCPASVQGLIPGDHIVVVKSKGYMTKSVPFKIVVSQQSLVTVDLEKAKEQLPVGTVRIQSDQPDAMVIMDGKRLGKAPMELKNVRTGLHIVKIEKRGFLAHEEKFTLKKGEAFTITALLKQGGQLKLTSSPSGATIWIDTKPIGQTPLMEKVLKVGTYNVEVELNGYHREKRTITVKGGQPISFHMDLTRIRTGPTPEQKIRGMTSFGAITVEPSQFTADITLGYMPYYLTARLTVGAFKTKRFGLDAGIILRVQGVINVFAAHARFSFLKAGPFSMAAFTEIGGGPGWEGRNTFMFNIGAIASLSFRNLITVSVRMWGKVYSDAFCPSDPASAASGESEPGWCSRLDDPATRESEMDVLKVPYRWKQMFKESDGAHRKRITEGRLMMSLVVEIAFARWASLHFELRGAPGMVQRAMWHDFFNRPMPISENGGDSRFYGGAGMTFKF